MWKREIKYILPLVWPHTTFDDECVLVLNKTANLIYVIQCSDWLFLEYDYKNHTPKF